MSLLKLHDNFPPECGRRKRDAGERFSVSLSTVEFLLDGTGTMMRVTEHGAYLDGNPEGPNMRAQDIGEQLELLGRSYSVVSVRFRTSDQDHGRQWQRHHC